MDAIKVQCLGWGKYKSNAFLVSKVLGLFEKFEMILYAHGMKASYEDVLISTLGTKDELPSKPKTPINMETWN
jgi:hypothetical protein